MVVPSTQTWPPPDNRNARQAWYWTETAKLTFIVGDDTAAGRGPQRADQDASGPADYRVVFGAAPFLVEVKFLQRWLVAGDVDQEDRVLVGSVDVLVPGAARDGERVELRPVETLAVQIECPLPSNGAISRFEVWRTGSERSPGRNISPGT